MVVRRGVGIEMILSVSTGELLDLSELHEEIQVAVNGSETDIREFITDAGINGICCGVILSSHQTCLDGLALTAVFQYFHKKLTFFYEV